MEVHKLNKFHWHLTEDQGWRIEIKKYPLLTEVGSIRKGTCVKKNFHSHDGVPYGEGLWYTQDQIREIVAYAASKGIDVIPEIDLPGHMLAALTAYPELGCTGGPYEVWTRWGVSDDVLCAGNEAIYTFLEDVLTEVCELFPYEYIHIGGDECPKTRWETCPKCQAKIKELGLEDKDGQKAEHYLQSYVISRMEKFLNSKGRSVIGWDEILEGGIAPNATIMSWRGETGGLEAARQGHDAIMTPNTYFYLDYYQSKDIANEPFGIGGYLPIERCYSYEPYPAGMTDEEKSHIIGVQANVWTEYISTEDHVFYMLLPRLAALSEVQWCNADRKDWGRFYDAADDFCDIYDTMGYNYAKHVLQVKSDLKVDAEKKEAVVTLSAQDDAPIYYTLEGTTPSAESQLYSGPIVVNETCQVKAVAMNKGVEDDVLTIDIPIHKALGKTVTYSRKPHPRYAAGLPQSLVDGIRGPQIFKSQEWGAWNGDPVSLTIDMEQTESFSSVTVGMISDKPSYVFFPEKITVEVSEDGENFREFGKADIGVPDDSEPDELADYMFTSEHEESARYIKITITPVKIIPDWHYAAGRRTYVFVDELIVL
jgi:hexosaminidase